MPLSDREQQILQEIEKNLLDEDPDLARNKLSPGGRGKRQLRAGVLVFCVGIVCLATFFVSGYLILGVGAFVAMVGGLVLIAGGISGTVAEQDFRDLRSGRRLGDAVTRWEQRLRDRYRRPD